MFEKENLAFFKADNSIEKWTVAEALDEIFEEMLLFGKRDRTIKDYRYHFSRMCDLSEITYVEEINRIAVLRYLKYGDISDAGKRVRLKSIRSILNKLYDKELLQKKFWTDIHIKVNEEIKEGTTKEELYKLISHLDFESFAQFRDACILLTIWESGVRLQTVSSLTVEMIDLDRNLLNIHGSIMKNHLPLQLPISEDLAGMLKHLIEWNQLTLAQINKESSLLFITEKGNSLISSSGNNIFNKRLSKYAKQCKFDNVSPHSLRRAFAKNLLNKGVNIAIISKALNHSSLEVTTKYLNISNDEVVEALRDVIS